VIDQTLLDQINMGERREHAEGDEFILDGASIPAASVQATDTSRFEGKVTFGDYTKDSDQLMSSWILTNWAGGGLINSHIEGATDNRFRWSTAWTMNSEQLALLPKQERFEVGDPYSIPDPDGQGAISNTIIEAFGGIYFSSGRDLWKLTGDRYTLTNLTWTKIGTFEGRPNTKGVLVTETMFAVGTDAGMQFVHSNDTIDPVDEDDPVIANSVLMWDGKLFATERTGHLRIYIPSAAAWDPKTDDLKIPAEEGRFLFLAEFWDRGGDPAVAIATQHRIWFYDANNQTLIPTTIRIPFHHNNAIGFTAWRDDALYYSTGLGVMRYTRDGVRTDVGMDRDDGLPDEVMRGVWRNENLASIRSHTINDMVPSYNYLIASANLGANLEERDCAFGYAVSSKIMAWNEAGWHTLADTDTFAPEADGYIKFAGNLMVTTSVGGYRLWWGETVARTDPQPWAGNPKPVGVPAIHTIELPRAFHGPRQKVLSAIGAFQPTGQLYSGWFDSGMRGFDKTWSHLEVYLSDPGDGLPVGGTVEVRYRLHPSDEWRVLGTATEYGINVLPFGIDADGFPRGETSREIELLLNLSTGDETRSPIVSAVILKYIKLPLEGRAWIATIDLDAENMKGLGPREIDEYLSRKTYEGGFTRLTHHRMEKRIRIAQHQIVEGTGDNPFMRATVNMIEVPLHGWTPGEDT